MCRGLPRSHICDNMTIQVLSDEKLLVMRNTLATRSVVSLKLA